MVSMRQQSGITPSPGGAVVDVGWRCWNCGFEWGFEVPEGNTAGEDAETGK